MKKASGAVELTASGSGLRLPRRRRLMLGSLQVGPQGQHRGGWMNKPQHVPVLLDEVLEYLNVRPGGVIC